MCACVMAAMSLDLPPGFRFRPTELEIINYYLRLKITGNDEEAIGFIREVDLLDWKPWELPGLSGIETTDQEWFYFSKLVKKHPNGKQKHRSTNSGFWKVSCGDKKIWSGGRLIGKRTSLAFYLGKNENSKKTDWKMYEYHTSDTTLEELDGTKLPGQKPLEYVFLHLVYEHKQDSGKAGHANGKLAEDHPITSNEYLHPENSDGMAYDTIATGTAKSASESPDKGCKGRKRKYSSKAGTAKSKRSAASASPALELQAIDHTATEEFLHSEISDTIPSVEYSGSISSAENQVAAKPNSFRNTAKCSPEEAEFDLTLASVSPASVQAEDYPTIYGTTSDTRAPVECGDNNFNAYPAENQVTDTEEEMYMLLLLDMLQDPPDCTSSLPNTTTFSSPPTAKSCLEQKAESEPELASVSPALGEEAGNHLTGCYSDGMASNTVEPTMWNHNSQGAEATAGNHLTGCYSDGMASNTVEPTMWNHNSQGAEATAGNQVGDSSSVALPIAFEEQDWGSIFPSLSPTHSQKQKVSDLFYKSDLIDNVPKYHHDGVPLQNGTNDPIAYVSKLLDLTPSNPDESLRNDPSSQKTTIPFDPRPCFMESDKDDGSHSAPIARKLNALFDPTVQDSMRSVEINRGDVSSGSCNDGGTSSIRSRYEFGYKRPNYQRRR